MTSWRWSGALLLRIIPEICFTGLRKSPLLPLQTLNLTADYWVHHVFSFAIRCISSISGLYIWHWAYHAITLCPMTETWKIEQGHGQGQTRWSHLKPRVQLMCLLFVLWQSDHFWLRYSQFDIWPWKFKVKVMAKVKPDGLIWSLEFSRCVCFSFRGNRTIFGWDIGNLIFDLENSRSRSRRKSPKI